MGAIPSPRKFKKQSNKHCDAKHCILPSMYALHLGSRWYTLDLQTVTIDIAASVPLWHQGLYPSIEEIGVQCSLINDKFMLDLLQTAYQSSASKWVQRDGNHWSPYHHEFVIG